MPDQHQNDLTPVRAAGRHRARTAAVVTAGVLALGAGVGVAGVAAADETPSPSPSASPSSGTSQDAPGGRGAGGPGRGGDRLAAPLAEELGVEESAVTEALRTAREEQPRPERDDSGTQPTEEEREAARAEREAALVTSLAGSLDLPEADVQTALDAVQAARDEEHSAALDERLTQAVEDGTLTRAEADAVAKAVGAGVVGGGHGPR